MLVAFTLVAQGLETLQNYPTSVRKRARHGGRGLRLLFFLTADSRAFDSRGSTPSARASAKTQPTTLAKDSERVGEAQARPRRIRSAVEVEALAHRASALRRASVVRAGVARCIIVVERSPVPII